MRAAGIFYTDVLQCGNSHVRILKTVEKEEYRLLLPHREPLTVRQRQAMIREWAFEVSNQ